MIKKRGFWKIPAAVFWCALTMMGCDNPARGNGNQNGDNNDPVEVTALIVPETGLDDNGPDGTLLGIGGYFVFRLDVNPPETAIQSVLWTTSNPLVLEIEAYPPGSSGVGPAPQITASRIRAYGSSAGTVTLTAIATIAGRGPITSDLKIEVDVIRTVTLNFYYGRPTAAIPVRYGETVELPTPTRAGHRFDGWFTDPAFTIPFDSVTPIYEDIALYAGWAEMRTVTFDTRGGSAVDNIYVWNGDTADAPTVPTRVFDLNAAGLFPVPLPQNFNFAGWYLDNYGTFDFSTPITADITLTAIWDSTEVDLSGRVGDTIIHRAFDYLGDAPAGTVYILALDDDVIVEGNSLSMNNMSGINLTLLGIGKEREIKLSSQGALFAVSGNATFVLDANIALQGMKPNNAPVLDVHGYLIMRTGSVIRGNGDSGNAGGVHVAANGTFIMEDGKISGNSANNGGVYVQGIFVMKSGEISGNNGAWNSGGVYVAANGTFIMEGGEIYGNTGVWNGGVHVAANGTFIMENGEISGNTIVHGSGGGVHVAVNGTFVMKNGEISNNTAEWGSSGGVHVAGTFTMESGTISGNTIHGNGGGVNVAASGTFVMKNGKISGNSASPLGGSGVFVAGTFTMKSGEISGNAVEGVNVAGTGTFVMEGGEISGHARGVDISLNGTFIMDDGEISGNGGGVHARGIFVMEGGEIFGNSYVAEHGGGVLVLTNGTFIMKGGEIFGNSVGNSGGGVSVFGTFNMEGGKISGNTVTGTSGGAGVSVFGTFVMEGGEISGNIANTPTSHGGGVHVGGLGTFVMKGGEIFNNITPAVGGGVHVGNGTFNMTGGTISGNTGAWNGGGVFVATNGIFNMEGGEISGNTTSNSGGGVFVSGIFQISAGVIYGSNAGGLANTAHDNSAALNVNLFVTPQAQRGTFSNFPNGFTSSGDLTTSNDTIRVLNGQLIDADGNPIMP